ncbi:hypothetical protein GGR57DRAFT_481865 [Xylariaceae sp. FL1272]|nr:hypothetical protein GGR57DRAFT_481865 [Xylariaceae sp. FL1272]
MAAPQATRLLSEHETAGSQDSQQELEITSPTGTALVLAEPQAGPSQSSSLSLSTNSRPTIARTFQLFPQLPPELRIMIWEFAVLEHNRDRLVVYFIWPQRITSITSAMCCSPHFSVSQESRYVALRLYPMRVPITGTKRFKRSNNQRYDIPQESAVYLSPEHDVFLIDHILYLRRRASAFELIESEELTPNQLAPMQRAVVNQPTSRLCEHTTFTTLISGSANAHYKKCNVLSRVGFPALKSCYNATTKERSNNSRGLVRDKGFKNFIYNKKKLATLGGLRKWMDVVEVNGEDLDVFRSGQKVDGKCICQYQGPRDEGQEVSLNGE